MTFTAELVLGHTPFLLNLKMFVRQSVFEGKISLARKAAGWGRGGSIVRRAGRRRAPTCRVRRRAACADVPRTQTCRVRRRTVVKRAIERLHA